MADAGMTTLEAVNMVLIAAGIPRVTALDASGSAGTSTEAEAEFFLEQTSREVQARGYPENTNYGVSHTAADVGGSVYKITLGTTVLDIKAGRPGDGDRRAFSIRNGFLWDMNRNTDDFGSALVIALDLIIETPFAECAAPLKSKIVAETAVKYQRFKQGSLARDAALTANNAVSEVSMARRTGVEPMPVPQSGPPGGQDR